MRDPYQILGVERGASDDELKRAFKRLAARHHPDRNPDDPAAQERFSEVNAAYQMLSDPKKRAMYDRFGSAAFAQGGGDVSVGIDDIFGDILSAFGIKSGDKGHIRKKVKLEFTEAALGCTKEIEYQRLDSCDRCHGRGGEPNTPVDVCSACNGRGKVRYQQGILPLAIERACSSCAGRGSIPASPCGECKGKGVVTRRRTLEVTIPEGVEAGASRVIEGAGNRLGPTGPAGDLELVIDVASHPFFRREGDDLICAVPISFAQAALGGEIDVPTLEGKVKMRVPPATQPGQVLRIRGKGVPHRVRTGRGDQLVEVSVEVPTELNEKARQLIEELGEELGEDVQPQQRTFVEKLKSLFG